MSERKKVLVVAEYGTLNGGERSLLAVINLLIERGWEFVVLLPRDTEFATELLRRNISTLPFCTHDEDGNRFSQSQIRELISNQIRSADPDLVHCNSLATSRLCGPITRKLKIPSLGYLRDIIKLSRQAISDINEIDQIIAVSNATKDFHVNRGMDSNKIAVIHNGVDLEKFAPPSPSASPPAPRSASPSAPRSASSEHLQTNNSIRDELKISGSDSIILFVGQIGRRKGVKILIDAFETVAAQLPATHLLIVGERNSISEDAITYESELHKKTVASSTSGQIHWLGRRTDVAAMMRESTLLIHPAKQEPLGRVLLEAAASGLPIITTDVGGSNEILGSLPQHRLLQPLDASSIANRAVEILSDVNQRVFISSDLRSLAELKFSNARCADALHACYLNLLSRPST